MSEVDTSARSRVEAVSTELNPSFGDAGLSENHLCQVDDSGHLTDPLAGRIPPPPDAEGGRGLILAHQLCDLVRIHARPSGTSIRLHMRR